MASKKRSPLTVKCPVCAAMPLYRCSEDGWPIEVPHEDRYQKAWLVGTAPIAPPKTKPLAVRCPRCGAMPLRTCTGPAPYRDPKPIHKDRWLAAQKIDNYILRKRGRNPRTSLDQKPLADRPWLKENTDHPEVQPLHPRELQAIRKTRDAARQARAAAQRQEKAKDE